MSPLLLMHPRSSNSMYSTIISNPQIPVSKFERVFEDKRNAHFLIYFSLGPVSNVAFHMCRI